MTNKTVKNFDILITHLSYIINFDGPIKLFLDLVKFLNATAKPFFPSTSKYFQIV